MTMTAMVAEDLAQIPMSPYLAASLERAAQYAEAQAHREVALEHVLLALAEDPEASVILRTSKVDIERLQTDVSNYIGNISDRFDQPGAERVVLSDDLQRILEAAAEAAKQGQRREINGAILLAAIVGDGNSPAAHILRAQGMTFETTIAALHSTVNQARQPSNDEDRERQQNRVGGHGVGGQPDAAGDLRPAAPSERQPEQKELPGELSTHDALARARERVNHTRTPPNPSNASPAPRPSLEPQWAPVNEVTPSGNGNRTEQRGAEQQPAQPAQRQQTPASLPAKSASADGPLPGTAKPEPPPVPHGDPQTRTQSRPPQSATANWTPPPEQAARQPRPGGPLPPGPPPRLQRAPPPLPPDAGLRTPSSESGEPRRSANGQVLSPSVQNQRPPHQQHVPPWIDDKSTATLRPPQARPGAGSPARPPASAQARTRSTQLNVETGQLVENIPRRMKTGVTGLVEVRIARAKVKALAEGLQGGGAAYKHEAMITKAMSVKLRAPDGGFWVEAASPETQWIDNVLGVMTDDFASWRWTVTPKSSGRKKLQLVVSARTVGSDGLAAETALPDQFVDVKVAVNYGQVSRRTAGWLIAAVIGGMLARFGEGAYEALKDLAGKFFV